MRVLVCGGRDFDDAGLMISVLDRLHTEKFFTVLIHGNAHGADRIADAWASCRGVPREQYEVPQGEWDEIGKRAGPLRSQRMLDEGKPDLVVAFPGAGGTKDMVRRAGALNSFTRHSVDHGGASGPRGQQLVKTLRVLARTNEPSRVVLIEKAVNEYLNDKAGIARLSLERLCDAIDREEAEKRQREDWSIVKDYVRSPLRRLA